MTTDTEAAGTERDAERLAAMASPNFLSQNVLAGVVTEIQRILTVFSGETALRYVRDTLDEVGLWDGPGTEAVRLASRDLLEASGKSALEDVS